MNMSFGWLFYGAFGFSLVLGKVLCNESDFVYIGLCMNMHEGINDIDMMNFYL